MQLVFHGMSCQLFGPIWLCSAYSYLRAKGQLDLIEAEAAGKPETSVAVKYIFRLTISGDTLSRELGTPGKRRRSPGLAIAGSGQEVD